MAEKKCISCQAELDADAIFCNECGTVQTAAVASAGVSEKSKTENYKICPQCLKESEDSVKFCSACMFDFSIPTAAAVSATCPGCQKVYDREDRFCRHCAYDLSRMLTVSSAHFCTSCGKSFEPTDKFCRGCAADLSKSNHTVVVPIIPAFSNVKAAQNRAADFVPSAAPVQTPTPFSPVPDIPVTPVEVNNVTPKPSGLQWISPSMAAFALICFFMPWVEVSCNAFGNRVAGTSVSGADLARFDGSLWFLPLLAIGILFVFFVFKSQENVYKSRPFIAAGAGLALLFMIFKALNLENTLRDMPNMGFGSEWRTGLDSAPRFGISGIIIGFIGTLIGVIFLGKKTFKDSISSIKPSLAGIFSYLVPLVFPPVLFFLLPLTLTIILFPIFGREGRLLGEFSLLAVILALFITQLFFLKGKPYGSSLFIRFHAYQSLLLVGLNIALNILLFIIMGSLKSIWARENLLPSVKLFTWAMNLSYIGLMIFCAGKANKNETFKIPYIGDRAMSLAQKGMVK